MRDYPDFAKELYFVLEKDGKIIGQIVFVKEKIVCDNGKEPPVMTMGPICIANVYKHQGYGKSGFTYASSFGIRYHGTLTG